MFRPGPDSDIAKHFQALVLGLRRARVVPFIGAGIAHCDRPPGEVWNPHRAFPPDGSELANYLAATIGQPDSSGDLVRIAQFIAIEQGLGPLNEELRLVFSADYQPNRLHRLIAPFPSLLRAKNLTLATQLIVTTNYDDLVERAFQSIGEPYDVVTYIARGPDKGKFLHIPPQGEGEPQVIHRPNEYITVSPDKRSVILKVHGAISRDNSDADSYVITEDQYIDYLTRGPLETLLPIKLTRQLKRSHLWFIGYGLKDWNLRVILHRIADEQDREGSTYHHWAVQWHPDPLETKFWKARDVQFIDLNALNCSLSDYADTLGCLLKDMPPYA